MASTSTYLQIADYALVEYIYESETLTTSQAKPLRLYNGYTQTYQFLNNAAATVLSGNVLDYSVARLGNGSYEWGYLDVDTVTPLIEIDSNFILEDLTASITPNLKYDSIKIHLLSGYDFPGLDGIILDVGWEEWNISGGGGKNFTPASQAYIKGEERIKFSSTPLFLGNRFYDRYIEFKIPSLSDTNFDFWNSPTATNTLGYQYTFNNVGFLQNSQIRITLHEITSTEDDGGNKYFLTGESYTTSFNSSDLYSYVGAVVRENPDMDYIEYYPIWNGQFISEFINLLNASGGDWVVVNQLELYEQLGSNFVKTFNMTSLQDTAFDSPSLYRPIVRNAALAISYTIEYTMRLMNRNDGQELVRKSTFSSFDVKKYGPTLQKINVLEGFTPIKVYNKIVQLSEDSIKTSVQYLGGGTKVQTQNVYINSYFNVNYISVDSTTNISTELGQTVYPQGMNTIFINLFDNYVKFKIFTKSADKKENVSLDLSSTGMNVKLAFIMNDNYKVYLDPIQDMSAADPGAGEIMFKIEDELAAEILGGFNKNYYIINKNEGGDEVLIYSGMIEDEVNKAAIMSQQTSVIISNLKSQIAELKSTAADLAANAATNTTTTAATNTTTTTTTTNTVVDATATGDIIVDDEAAANEAIKVAEAEKIAKAQQSITTVESSSQGTKDAIIKAGNSGNVSKLNIVEIPGVKGGMIKGSPIFSALAPNVIKPSKPKTKIKDEDISSSALKKKTKQPKPKKK